jgi:hypothetical protein
MDSAILIGRFLGRTTAYVQAFIEVGGLPTAGVILIGASRGIVKDIAESHKIDSSSDDVVTDNLFDCLQYID